MKLTHLLSLLTEAAAPEAQEIPPPVVTGEGGEWRVAAGEKRGLALDMLIWVAASLRKRGVTITTPSGVEATHSLLFRNRPAAIKISFAKPEGAEEKVRAAVEKAVQAAAREAKSAARRKAEAPARAKARSAAAGQRRREDLAAYAEKYGKGTWNRVTYRQEGGDDGYQYVVRVDGRPTLRGLTQRQASYEKEREVDAIAKREKLGKYAPAKKGD